MDGGQQGICVEWDNPQKTIIRWDFYDWTWEDFHAAAQTSIDLRATVNDRLHVPSILNFKNSGSLPASGAFSHARAALEKMAARDYTVIAEASGYVRAMAHLFTQFDARAREKVLIARTVEEARILINKRILA
jgi:hypothetical protein